jgi:hypothetical protein
MESATDSPLRLRAWHFAGLLGVMLFGAFPRVMSGQDSFFFRDYGVLGYPFVFFHHESFWRGELPLWNPLSNCGAPFLAQWGTMTLYPFSLIYLLFPLPWSLGYFCLAHLFLGGLGMYFLAREWTGNEFAAAFAGVAYVFNGVTFSCVAWPNYLVALGWMPWVVLWAQRAWRCGGRSLVVAAICGALQMLAGVPELVILTWLLIGALWATECLAGKTDLKSGGRIAMTVALIAGLSAAQLLPFFDLVAHSQRTRDFATSKWSMPGWGWANFLVPLFHTYKSYQGVCFQHEQAFMTSYYPGIAVLVLAGWAVWKVRVARVWTLGLLVLFSWIMALGENGFVYSVIKQFVPIMGFARFPIKFILLATFILPLLGAVAVSALGTEIQSRRIHSLATGTILALLLAAELVHFAGEYPYPLQRWNELWWNTIIRSVLLIAILGACVASYGKWIHWRKPAALVVLGLLFVDATTHTTQQNPTIPTTWFTPALWQQRNGADVGRVFITGDAEKRLLHSTVTDPLQDFIGRRLALWSNLNVVDGIPKVNGSSTLRLREQDLLEKALYPSNSTARPREGILDLLGVTHLTGSNIVEWEKRGSACPLVTAGQGPVFRTNDTELGAIMEESFEPRSTVYLPEELRGVIVATNATSATVKSIARQTGRISFTVAAEQPSMVVVAQSYYHVWQAKVDDQTVPIRRANYAFQALEVPGGEHQVMLIYRDRKLILGGVISAMSVLACACCWRRARRETTSLVLPG